jgi:two-component sensor histidine kinase
MVEVDLVEYARDLVSMVRRAIAISPKIETHVLGDPIKVGADQAVPCGLVINELVTNACKHAFAGDRAGNVFVEVRRAANSSVILAVRDDGIGLPLSADLADPSGVGLDLVVTLARQLDAALVVKRDAGTSFELTIPLPRSRHEQRI